MTLVSSTVIKVYKNRFSPRLETYKVTNGFPIMTKRIGQFYVTGVNSLFTVLLLRKLHFVPNKDDKQMENQYE